MKDTKSSPELTRRTALKSGMLGMGGLALSGTGYALSTGKYNHKGENGGSTPEVIENPIAAENTKSGDDNWSDTANIEAQAPQHFIEGYASRTSIEPGNTLDLHVSAIAENKYKIDVHRLGWYHGSGGRRVAQLDEKQGQAQPIPTPDEDTGYADAGWNVTNSLDIGDDWTTGLYLAQFILTTGPYKGESTWYPFIVKQNTSNREGTADILVEPATATWQAYNDWAGKSLYGFNSTDGTAADKVSYNRPLHNPLYPHFDDGGPMAVYYWEDQVIRFLERNDYDVAYTTNDDVHSNPDQLKDHKAILTIGHNEYWSKAERDGYEAARDAGVNLSFISGNTAYWQVRYEDDTRTQVGYKANVEDDPKYGTQKQTSQFGELPDPRPECELTGVDYNPPITSNTASHFPAYTVTEAADDHPWFQGTNLQPGEKLEEIVGYENSHIVAGCDVPGKLTELFTFDGDSPYLEPGGDGAQAVTYTAPSGAKVFASASMNFAWALSDMGTPWNNPNPEYDDVQQFVKNMLDDMTDNE